MFSIFLFHRATDMTLELNNLILALDVISFGFHKYLCAVNVPLAFYVLILISCYDPASWCTLLPKFVCNSTIWSKVSPMVVSYHVLHLFSLCLLFPYEFLDHYCVTSFQLSVCLIYCTSDFVFGTEGQCCQWSPGHQAALSKVIKFYF